MATFATVPGCRPEPNGRCLGAILLVVLPILCTAGRCGAVVARTAGETGQIPARAALDLTGFDRASGFRAA